MDKADGQHNLKRGNERKNSIITISILISIALIAFIGITYQVALNNAKTGYVSLKPVDVTLSSEGKEHNLSVKITLSGKSKNLNKLNMESVQLATKETIKQLDYDTVIAENGNEYIKNTVLTSLRQEFGEDIEQVNIESILTDVSVPSSQEEEYKNEDIHSVEEYLKGFSWSKKN